MESPLRNKDGRLAVRRRHGSAVGGRGYVVGRKDSGGFASLSAITASAGIACYWGDVVDDAR